MKIEVKEINSCQKRLEVEIPLEVVRKELDILYRNLQKKVKVKGFRPGKAPRGILERLYKTEVENELISKIIPDTYAKIIQENNIKAVGAPRVDEVELEKEKPLRFAATVDIIPEISLESYGGWELIKKIGRVTEDQLKKELERLREIHAQWDTVDGPAKEGDYVVLNYQGFIAGEKLPELKAENMEVIIGSNFLPATFEEKLMGMNNGERKNIKVAFPPDYGQEKLAGKEVLFEVQLNEIKAKRLTELNDDFAKEVREDIETLEELKEKVFKDLEAYAAETAEALLKEEIINRLLEENPFSVPENLIEAETQRMLQNMENRLKQQGMKLEDPEAYREKFRESALKNIRAEIILEHIKKLEGIEISEEEVDKEIKELAASVKQSEEIIKKELGERVRNQLGRDKTLDLLARKSKIREEFVEPEELDKNKDIKEGEFVS